MFSTPKGLEPLNPEQTDRLLEMVELLRSTDTPITGDMLLNMIQEVCGDTEV